VRREDNPWARYLRISEGSRFLSLAVVVGVFFLLLVSLTIEALHKVFSQNMQSITPDGLP
jgi:hypothetical protein